MAAGSLGNGESLRMVSGSPSVTLEFRDDGATLQGNTGCNGYSGTYTVDDKGGPTLLMFLGMVSFGITEGGCPTREPFQREVAYQDTHARSATLAGPRLTITGSVLVLDRRRWPVRRLTDGGDDVAGGVQ